MSGPARKFADATAEERAAWDRYAAASLISDGFDDDDDGLDYEQYIEAAAAYADGMLTARRARFGVPR